jgi:DNA-binding SARP family transcriptional activator
VTEMPATRLEFRILGPLSLRVDGSPVALGGPKQRALLALLLLNANRVVSRDRLVAELFPEQSVNSADHALRNHVSRLRKVFAAAGSDEPRLAARAPGYLLRVEPGELDLARFEQLVSEGREALRAGRTEAAAVLLRSAEHLWEGRPFADLEFEPFGRLEVERLEELRLAAVEERIDADLALGRQLALVPELETLAAEHPFREHFRAQLMVALYRSGRQAEGLAVYQRTRTLLSDELGLEPGSELQELQRSILVQDPALAPAVVEDWNRRPSATSAPSRVWRRLNLQMRSSSSAESAWCPSCSAGWRRFRSSLSSARRAAESRRFFVPVCCRRSIPTTSSCAPASLSRSTVPPTSSRSTSSRSFSRPN